MPTPLLISQSPCELIFKNSPSYMHLNFFGFLCYATYKQAYWTKFDSRARKSIFMGYKDDTKGFILYDLSNHENVLSRNFIFYESFFLLNTMLSQHHYKLSHQTYLTIPTLLMTYLKHNLLTLNQLIYILYLSIMTYLYLNLMVCQCQLITLIHITCLRH